MGCKNLACTEMPQDKDQNTLMNPHVAQKELRFLTINSHRSILPIELFLYVSKQVVRETKGGKEVREGEKGEGEEKVECSIS